MRNKQSMGEYLYGLAARFDVYSGEFLQALFTSRDVGKAICGCLSIECRNRTDKEDTFLIMRGSEVVAQFPIQRDFFLNPSLALNLTNYAKSVFRPPAAEEGALIRFRNIKDVRSGMNHVNLKAKIAEISKPRQLKTMYGTISVLTKIFIEDETGKIPLCLWNEQTENLSIGDRVFVENARASNFAGKTQLRLGVKGKIHLEESLPTDLVSVPKPTIE